jgi:hypothetical protein
MSIVMVAVVFGGIPLAILVGVTALVYLPSLISRKGRDARSQSAIPAKRIPSEQQGERTSTAEASAH